jgi:hypothetical protein
MGLTVPHTLDLWFDWFTQSVPSFCEIKRKYKPLVHVENLNPASFHFDCQGSLDFV